VLQTYTFIEQLVIHTPALDQHTQWTTTAESVNIVNGAVRYVQILTAVLCVQADFTFTKAVAILNAQPTQYHISIKQRQLICAVAAHPNGANVWNANLLNVPDASHPILS